MSKDEYFDRVCSRNLSRQVDDVVERVQVQGGPRVRGDLGSKSRGLSAGADLLVVRYEFFWVNFTRLVRSGCFLTLSPRACTWKWTY